MSPSLLINLPFAVQIHVAAALSAVLLGGILLLGRKGTGLHRVLGRIWICLMVATALSSFFIRTMPWFFGYSPIHVLSILTLLGCWQVVSAARTGRIAEHQRHVGNLYAFALVTAGAFTLLPGRLMHKLLFGEGQGQACLFALGILLASAVLLKWWLRRGTRHQLS